LPEAASSGNHGSGRGPRIVSPMTRVLVIGLDPAELEGWDPGPVQAAIARGRTRFDDHDIAADYCLVSPEGRPEQAVAEALTGHTYACVVIGGGIRTHEPLLELFERVVNLVRRHAPAAAIAFNSSPEDCVDAALRWLR
jgi:hypothetical protein